MPRGYDALRDVLAASNSPTQTKPDIKNLLNSDPRPLSSLLPAHRVPRDSLSPITRSAPLTPTLSSPRSPSSTPNQKMLPVPAVPVAIPYNPINRRTPPTSVLIPLTPAELESFKIPRHALRVRAQRPDPALEDPNFFPPSQQDVSPQRKRKREREEEKQDEQARASKRSRDSGLVVNHYNARPEVGVSERRESPIIGLKSFNNWIKSVLIAKFSKQAFEGGGAKGKGKVLDMGCGKGGDLMKWQRARVREYVGVDIADVSVQQARERYASTKGHRFDATFAALDCYTESLTTVLSSEILARPFDAVSMQFCMHYAFESVPKVRMMLENVSKYLRKGGVFMGTIPNAELLMERLNLLPADAPPKFGNSVYQIRFEERHKRAQLFGHRYWFYLKDAVEDVPEYVVEWENFEQLALEHGLHLLYKREFHDMFAEEREDREHGPLLQRMKVVTESGESKMDEDQWEAANIYLAFAFEKR